MESFEKFKAKYLAAKRAQWRLKQRFETIDHEYELKEEVEALKEGYSQGQIPQITVETE